MSIYLPEQCPGDPSTPIHRWDPRLKLVSLMILIFACSFVQHITWLVPLIILTSVLFRVSQVPFSLLLSRLKLPGLFILTLAVFLPFGAGTQPVFFLGPWPVMKEGLEAFGLIAVKATTILTLGLILFNTTKPTDLFQAMGSLGLPALLVDMTLFSYRFLFQLERDLERMNRAARLRGQRRFSLRSLPALSHQIGTLLVRSYEQSERVYLAMTLRGYGAPRPMEEEKPLLSEDRRWLMVCLTAAVLLLIVDVYWGKVG